METKMTFDEVMAALGVKTRQTIYNYIERGLLTPIKTFPIIAFTLISARLKNYLKPLNRIPFAEE